MARINVFVDDLTEELVSEGDLFTVRFAFDDQTFELEVSGRSMAELQNMFRPVISRAKPVPASQARRHLRDAPHPDWARPEGPNVGQGMASQGIINIIQGRVEAAATAYAPVPTPSPATVAKVVFQPFRDSGIVREADPPPAAPYGVTDSPGKLDVDGSETDELDYAPIPGEHYATRNRKVRYWNYRFQAAPPFKGFPNIHTHVAAYERRFKEYLFPMPVVEDLETAGSRAIHAAVNGQ